MENFIRIYDNAISPIYCQKIIEVYEEKLSQSIDYKDSSGKFGYVDLASIGMVDLSNAIIKFSIPLLQRYLNETTMSKYLTIKGVEGIKLKKYKKNTDNKITPHFDSWNVETGPRFLQFLYYLNDNDGYTTFPLMGFKNKPKQGSMLIFPPYFTHLHTAENPTDHDKYTINSSLRFV